MRRLLSLVMTTTMVLGNVGCFIPIYSADPNERTKELLNQSEDLRQIQKEWQRIWFTDQPSHLTIDRVHGGMQ